MHAFHTLAYLDVEKSGSTYVSQFLRDFLDDDEVRFRKHWPLEDRPPAGRLHVLSVRDPFETYLSLYSYGCQGRGGLAGTLRYHGFGDLYDGSSDGFRHWLDVVLDPARAAALNPPAYHRSGVAPYVGLVSFRVARLAMPRVLERMSQVTSTQDFLDVCAAHSIVDVVLHNETLVEDLERLVLREDLRWRPSREAALAALHRARRLNHSERLDQGAEFTIPDGARDAVLAREPLLADVYGYGGGDHRTSTTERIHARSSA